MKRAVAVLALLSAPVLATAIRPFAGMRGDANLGGNTPNGSPTSAVPSPTFDLVAGATTPNDLPDALTVNSTAMTLLLACDAQGVSGTNWSCRNSAGALTLSEAGTGSSPVSSIQTPFRASDSLERVVRYISSGKRHDAPTSSVGDIGSEDIAVEYVGKLGAVSGANIIEKGTAGTTGWTLAQSGTLNVNLRIKTAGVFGTVTAGGSHTDSFVHTIFFIDRDEASINGSFGYGNGTAGSGVNMSTRAGSLSTASVLALGAASGGTANDNTVASIRVWTCSACFAGGATNPLQWGQIARSRSAVAWGVYPSIAAGSAAPTALTRTSTAYVDVVDGVTRHLYSTGTAAPRVARRTHGAGIAVSGYMSEPAVSNIALQSQTLGTTWTAITVGDNVLADAFAGADLTTTGDNIDGNNSNAEHGLRQGITLTAAAHTFSAWAKTGTQNFVALRNATIANGVAWFDVATCTSSSCVVGENCASAVGTTQAGISRASAERYPIDTTGDGVADVNLCRVSITYTGTAVSHNHDLLCAPSNGNLAYTDSDAAADCGFWGVRVEAFPVATSYLATTTAAAARNADDVRFDGASHYTGSPSTMETAVLCPSFDTGVQSTFASVGTGAANYARLGVDATADRGQGGADVAGVQWLITAASGDISDGVAHTLRQTMATNNIQAYVDGVSIGTDALATLPTVASSFVYLGTAGSTASQSACLISRARLWSSSVAP